MPTYAKLNNNNILENVILAEKDFINNQPDKDKYIKIPTNNEEIKESITNTEYSLNYGQTLDISQYNYQKRKFKNPSPSLSWIWNEKKYEWEPPIPKPNKDFVAWDEDKQNWVDVNPETGEFIK
jgi:hypothetical protein